jgi:hypothetical protein
MSMETIDVGSLKVIAGIVGSLFGWIALRLENFGHRLVRVETRLDNGISELLNDLKADLKLHTDGEETRIAHLVDRARRIRK